MPIDGSALFLSEEEHDRLLCHVLIQYLPHAAFHEARDALIGMHEYYRQLPVLTALPAITPMRGRISKEVLAPIYQISDE